VNVARLARAVPLQQLAAAKARIILVILAVYPRRARYIIRVIHDLIRITNSAQCRPTPASPAPKSNRNLRLEPPAGT